MMVDHQEDCNWITHLPPDHLPSDNIVSHRSKTAVKSPATPSVLPRFKIPENWASVPEFVPRSARADNQTQIPQSVRTVSSRTHSSVAFGNRRHYSGNGPTDTEAGFGRGGSTVAREFRGLNSVQAKEKRYKKNGLLPSPAIDPTPKRQSYQSQEEFEAATNKYYTEQLCPYAVIQECRYGDTCVLVHGNKCETCDKFALHPFSKIQNDWHARQCLQKHTYEMELAFAIAESADKRCGVCLELVMAKSGLSEQRFGILPSCPHCFCLSCIRRWRKARQFENHVIRSCPECRVTSDFVCPSRFWMSTKEKKDALIQSYKQAMSEKPCKYLTNGSTHCPFGSKCFYNHTLPRTQAASNNSAPSASPTQTITEAVEFLLRRPLIAGLEEAGYFYLGDLSLNNLSI